MAWLTSESISIDITRMRFWLTFDIQRKKLVLELVVARRLDHMHAHGSVIKGTRNLGTVSITIDFSPSDRVGIYAHMEVHLQVIPS